MVDVTFVQHDGTEIKVAAEVGDNIMQVAIQNDIDGIVGECGGSMACATCHVYVDSEWEQKISPRSESEEEMLECAASEMAQNSRLSCQISLSQDLDGLKVHLPETQL